MCVENVSAALLAVRGELLDHLVYVICGVALNFLYLLAVALREILQELACSENLTIHQRGIFLQSLAERLFGNVVDLGDKSEILFGGVEVDQEMFVDKRTREGFPRLAPSHILIVAEHPSARSLNDIEHQSQEGSLTSSIVTNKSHQFTRMDGQFGNIQYGVLTVFLLQLFYFEFHIEERLCRDFNCSYKLPNADNDAA